jgi:hypothetical protein
MREMMGGLGRGGGLLSKIPGLGRFAGGGMPPGLDPSALLGGRGGAPGIGGPPVTGVTKGPSSRDRARNKSKRKQAKKDRKKGRRR